jgi:hypothetical protein
MTNWRTGAVRCLAICFLGFTYVPTALPSTLAENRQRLLSDVAARAGAGACDLWNGWPDSTRKTFLTITHRLSLYHLSRTAYADQVNAPSYATGDDMLSHILSLYAVHGTETGEGIIDSRMFMGMDRDLWIAMVLANKVGHDSSNPQPPGWAELQSESPTDYVRDQHDPGTVHDPFNCENETKGGRGDFPGTPTGQMQFFKPVGGNCQQFASSSQLDGFGNWESSGTDVPISRADNYADPYMMEMDEDFDFLHHSDPSRPDFWQAYIDDYGDPDSGWVPECSAATCPGPSTNVYQGSLTYFQSATHPIGLLPCQTVTVDISSSAGSRPDADVNMSLAIRNSSQTHLLDNNFLCTSSCTASIGPLPGTRGTGGRPSDVVLSAGYFNWWATPPAPYKLTVRKGSRPDYNTGGDSFDNAASLEIGVTERGGLSWAEVGEFYKIHLQAHEAVSLRGQVTGPMYGTFFGGSYFSITLYSASQQFAMTMVNLMAPQVSTVAFPSAGTNPMIYQNGDAEADFYLFVRSQYEATHDFQFTVQNESGQP